MSDQKSCREADCPVRSQALEEAKFCPKCGRGLQAQAPGAEDPLIGEVIAQRYRILRLIGRGGMGVVYKVEHIVMGKIMAMKLLHAHVNSRQNAVKRFRQEIKIVSRLSHVNTISVFDCGVTGDGSLFIVMEYLRGTDLERLLEHHQYIGCIRAARIARQVCASLAEAHEIGIIHRDIKPANIILLRDRGAEDFVKVLDFGIAKLLEPGQNMVTEVGLIVGTPYYMSPEQAMGRMDLGPAVDIYSLGVVLYEMAAGRLPFLGENTADYIHAHLNLEPPRPSVTSLFQDIDPDLDDLIMQALQKDERQRFPSIDAMQTALDHYIHGALSRGRHDIAAVSGVLQYSHVPSLSAIEPYASPPTDYRQKLREQELAETNAPTEIQRLPSPSSQEVVLDAPRSETPVPVEKLVAAEAKPLPATASLDLPVPLVSEPPEEQLATRADWDRVEKQWQRSYWMKTWGAFLLLSVVAAGWGGWAIWERLHRINLPKAAYYDSEQENNNTIEQSTPIRVGHWVEGELGQRLGPSSSDRDWYSFEIPQKGAFVSIRLQPPTFLDVELGLYRLRMRKEQKTRYKEPEELISINNTRRGGEERLRGYHLDAGRYYVLVRELVVLGEPPQEYKGRYRLKVGLEKPAGADEEHEPNDQFAQAKLVPKGKMSKGYHDRVGDADFWAFLTPASKERRYVVRFFGVPKVSAEFALLDDRGQPITFWKRSKRIRRKGIKERATRTDLFFSGKGKIYLRVYAKEGHSLDIPYALRLVRR
ncbi:MAG: serine/threonine protein kinase [Myxococcales bacterium]|nr:serine/threonine protein kinase [Myxococcales bacterium]